VAQPITREFLADVLALVTAKDPVVEFGSMQVEADQDIDLRRFFPDRPFIGTDFREGPGVDRVEDLRGLTFADGEIGTAVSLDTLEHCADPVTAVREMHRVLRPDGGLCLISSVMLFGIHGYPNDYFRFTPEGFRQLLEPFDDVWVCGIGEQGIPREVFGVGIRGGSLDALSLDRMPQLAAHQKWWDDAAGMVRIGPLRYPPRQLAKELARESKRLVRERLRGRSSSTRG
jgi:SAM-dependent methyltransferase